MRKHINKNMGCKKNSIVLLNDVKYISLQFSHTFINIRNKFTFVCIMHACSKLYLSFEISLERVFLDLVPTSFVYVAAMLSNSLIHNFIDQFHGPGAKQCREYRYLFYLIIHTLE